MHADHLYEINRVIVDLVNNYFVITFYQTFRGKFQLRLIVIKNAEIFLQ